MSHTCLRAPVRSWHRVKVQRERDCNVPTSAGARQSKICRSRSLAELLRETCRDCGILHLLASVEQSRSNLFLTCDQCRPPSPAWKFQQVRRSIVPALSTARASRNVDQSACRLERRLRACGEQIPENRLALGAPPEVESALAERADEEEEKEDEARRMRREPQKNIQEQRPEEGKGNGRSDNKEGRREGSKPDTKTRESPADE